MEIGCAACGKKEAHLKRCGICMCVCYCGQDCQKRHWKEHKQNCHEYHQFHQIDAQVKANKNFQKLIVYVAYYYAKKKDIGMSFVYFRQTEETLEASITVTDFRVEREVRYH